MRETAEKYQVNPFNVSANIESKIKYFLRYLKLNNNIALALASYVSFEERSFKFGEKDGYR